jgi:hypothetical protein
LAFELHSISVICRFKLKLTSAELLSCLIRFSSFSLWEIGLNCDGAAGNFYFIFSSKYFFIEVAG